MKRMKVERVPITEASSSLRKLARRIHEKKSYLILEDRGEPVVGIMDADELEDYLELQDEEVQAEIRESFRDYREGRARPATDFLAELEAEIAAQPRWRERR
jgi:PHD/YefM family antitoxin component YafN of YafNO toxin-antitoxin module